MKGMKKLAVIAVGALVMLAAESQAAVLMPKSFSFFGTAGSRNFSHAPGFYMYFVQWRKSSVPWTPANIQWAKTYGYLNGTGAVAPWSSNHSTGPGPGPGPGQNGEVGYPKAIPEPTSVALLIGGAALLLGRRRAAK